MALTPSGDQVLLLPRGYSFFNSAVQFSTAVRDSEDVLTASYPRCIPALNRPQQRRGQQSIRPRDNAPDRPCPVLAKCHRGYG
jgi:hypothetical protein